MVKRGGKDGARERSGQFLDDADGEKEGRLPPYTDLIAL